MINKVKFSFFWIIFLVVSMYGETRITPVPQFRIEIWQDTIYLGEPILIKCWLINNNEIPVKIWNKHSRGLLIFGCVDFYLFYPKNDTARYDVGINAEMGSLLPGKEILPFDSIYWHSILGWHNFARSKVIWYQPGEFKIKGVYYLSIKDEDSNSLLYFGLESNVASFVAVQIPDSEKAIYDEWIPLTREYFWWGERFRDRWVREDYNELCKRVSETKSRFAAYAHYIYCKSTGDKKAMREFLDKYPVGPLSELIEFMLDPDKARQKFPLNFLAK